MEQMCRVCMSDSDTLMDIFSIPKLEEASLVDMLNECTDCDVLQEDPLPNQICQACVLEAKNAYRFKRKFEASQRNFWEMLFMKKDLDAEEFVFDIDSVKTEPPEFIDEEPPSAKEAPTKCFGTILSIKSPTYSTEHAPKESSLSTLLSDSTSCVKSKPLQCPHCARTFKDSFGYYGHMKEHRGTPYKCKHCSITFGHKQQLEQHSLDCGNVDLPFKCTHCTKSFSIYANLQLHQRFHSAAHSYICPHCSRGFQQLANLEKHERTHLPHKCPHCPRTFTRRQDANYHLFTHTGERPFKCPHCPKAFRRKQHANYHLFTHTQQTH